MPPILSPRERAHLKARAHFLEPVVHIGQARLSDSVVVEIDRALLAHELIKVKIGVPDRDERRQLAEDLCVRTDAAAVQQVGRILVLWRPKPDDPSEGD